MTLRRGESPLEEKIKAFLKEAPSLRKKVRRGHEKGVGGSRVRAGVRK